MALLLSSLLCAAAFRVVECSVKVCMASAEHAHQYLVMLLFTDVHSLLAHWVKKDTFFSILHTAERRVGGISRE